MRGMICENTSIVTMGILYGLAGAGAAAILSTGWDLLRSLRKGRTKNDEQDLQELRGRARHYRPDL